MAGSASLFSGLFPNFVFLLSSSPLTPKKNRSEVHEAGQEARDEAEELITKASKQFRLEVEKAEHRLKQFESESAAAVSDRCFDSGAELCGDAQNDAGSVVWRRPSHSRSNTVHDSGCVTSVP